MIPLGHISYPTLVFMLFAYVFKIGYSFSDIMLLIFFSMLPDLDIVVHYILNSGKIDNNARHHAWFTHWPITYTPFLILFLIYHNMNFFLMTFGIYFHLLLDIFFSGDGIMWFYPFSKKYFNFFADKTKNRIGFEWLAAYKKLPIFKIDIISFSALMFILFRRF